MILRIVFFLSYGMLVSSNNGYPIIPAQTYPIYQQNGYSNPPANQPSDIASYLQGLMVQNQSPTLDLSPSNIRQILLNRILSGQSVSFDQNSSGYGSNFVEFPTNAITPNAVNNYFATPTMNNQLTKANMDDKTETIKTEEKRKKPKRRKSKSSRKYDESEKDYKNSNKTKANDIQESDRETRKKSKKRSRKPKKEDASDGAGAKNSENDNDAKTKKKKRKNKENEANNHVENESHGENPHPRKKHKKKPKPDKDSTETVILEQTTNKPKQIQEGINVAHINEGIVEENRFARNPIPEGGDLFKSILNLPEGFANSFKGLPQFNNPAMSNFFANYENIYQSMMAKNKGTNEHIEIKKRIPARSRKTKRRKVEVKNKNSTVIEAAVSKTPRPTVTPKVNVITTEQTTVIKEKPRTNNDPIPKAEVSKSIEKLSEEKETTNEFENEEIKDMESNINDPDHNYEGYIDDYYPQFTDSAAYNANKREVYVKNLGDNKYYYAVDKRNPELINRMRFESFGLPARILKEYDINKKYDDIEKEGNSNAFELESKDEEEVIRFRSPPHLEIPDFQTRKVEISEINTEHYNLDENDVFDPRYLADKASFYSEAKIPHYPGTKDNSKKIQKEKPKDVETVFARSKVVNYGPVYNPEDDDSVSAGTSHEVLTNDSYFKDGGTTYVLATTLDHPTMAW